MTAKKKSTPAPRHRRTGAEAAPIWEDEDGNPGPAPTGPRAPRRAILGDGVAAVTLHGPSTLRDQLLGLNSGAWRVERRDGTITILCRRRGPGMRMTGVTIEASGTVDVSGGTVHAGDLLELRWPM